MSQSLKLRADVLEWREVDGEIVALDLRRSVYLTINATGAVLWPQLAAGATRGELATLLCDRFGISPEVAAQDVGHFIDDIAEQGLLE